MQCKVKLFAIIIFILTSCKLGQKYEVPKFEVEIPEKFKEAGVEWEIFTADENKETHNWWHLFNDPYLNELITRLNENNNNIKAAESSYMLAMHMVDKARNGYLPSLSATASLVRGKESPTAPRTISRSLLLDSSWELDVWGNIRNNVESAQASADVAKANYADALLSAQGSLAQYYYELKMLDRDQELLDKIVEANHDTLEYMKNRKKAGIAGEQDIISVEQQLEQAKNTAISNKVTRSQYEHAIAVLVGEFATNFSFHPKQGIYPNINVPLILPSQMLQYRPDIIASERQVAIASANIGIAKSAFFPSLSLTASGSFEGTGAKKLASLPSLVWSVGPQLALDLTNLAAYKATMLIAREAYNASIANYKETVLSAFQDVEDNMVSLRILTEQVEILTSTENNAKKNVDILLSQYKSGIEDKSQVFAAQISYYNAQKNLNDTKGLRISSAIGLIKALGGIWNPNIKNIELENPATQASYENFKTKAG